MNFNTIIFADFETTSANPNNTQPTQLAAVAIEPRKLEIIEDSVFCSYIKPVFDTKEQEECGLGPIEDKALEVTGISIETLERAPSLKVVWSQFENFVNQFNPKKTLWASPIMAGFNNNKFDDVIMNRIMGGNRTLNPTYREEYEEDGQKKTREIPTKEPYKFGPWNDEKKQGKLFHPRDNLDLMKILMTWFENDSTVKSISMDRMREKFGLSSENAHNAICDVSQGASLLIKFLKLQRHVHSQMRTKFDNSCEKENQIVARILNQHVK